MGHPGSRYERHLHLGRDSRDRLRFRDRRRAAGSRMKQVGDVGALWRRAGLGVVIGRTLGNPNFLFGVTAMAVAFFSLLFALSWGDVSLVAPAAASLTFIGNAVAAKIFLHEKVDRRRWIAAGLVASGGGLLGGGNPG